MSYLNYTSNIVMRFVDDELINNIVLLYELYY